MYILHIAFSFWKEVRMEDKFCLSLHPIEIPMYVGRKADLNTFPDVVCCQVESRDVNQLTGSSTGLSRKLKFLPIGIGIPTSRRDENWPVANSHPSWM